MPVPSRRWRRPALQCMLAACSLQCAGAQIDPDYATGITLYHINPPSAGALPIDQDTGDVDGDLYFYLGQFLLPEECANKTAAGIAGFDCDNTERAGALVATQVRLEVDNRFTHYHACNLCNGTDPFTGRPCQIGHYKCDCYSRNPFACDDTKVGRESVVEQFAPPQASATCEAAMLRSCGKRRNSTKDCYFCAHTHSDFFRDAGCTDKDLFYFCPGPFGLCSDDSPDWQCWRENIVRKTGGYWYSTLNSSMCTKSSRPGTCGWRALSTRSIKETCLREHLLREVESQNRRCFEGCGPRNETSSCWTGCFFDTVLGPRARNTSQGALGGLPLTSLQQVWEGAFRNERQGGCPAVDSLLADALPTADFDLEWEQTLLAV